MNIHDFKQLKEIKQTYQNKISQAVADLIQEFETKTGLNPNSVYIEMIEISNMEEGIKRYIVGQTVLRVEV